MDKFQLKIGTAITYHKRHYIITAEDAENNFELRRVDDNQQIILTKDDLLEGLIDGVAQFVRIEKARTLKPDHKTLIAADFLTYPDKKKEQARRKKTYVQALIHSNIKAINPNSITEVIVSVAEKINDDKPPHWSTVYRWHRKYLSAGNDIRALSSQNERKGNRLPILLPEVQALIDETIDKIYLTLERPSISKAFSKLCTKIDTENTFREIGNKLEMPSFETFRRNIRNLDPEIVVKRHYGDLRAKTVFRAYTSGPKVSRILERVEMDHTPLPCFVIDDVDRLPLGRPTLTSIIDYYSRSVLGFYVSFNEPSTIAVMQALKYAIFPKQNVKKKYTDIQNEWECYGLPDTLVIDNGKEFHGEAFLDACDGIGISYQHAPPRLPWYKGVVERHFGTMNSKLLSDIPGKTFSSIAEKDNYDPSKNAIISFSSLVEMIHYWVIDIYNQTPQKTLRMAPAEMWRRSAEEFPPNLPDNLERLNIELGIMGSRTIQKTGITYKGILFNNEELAALRRKLPPKQQVKFKINPSDITYINVLDPILNLYFMVHASDQRIVRNKTLHQYETIKKLSLKKFGKSNRESIIKAEKFIQRIMESELKKTKSIKSRRRQAKFKNISQDIDAMVGLESKNIHASLSSGDEPVENYIVSSKNNPSPKENEVSMDDLYADDSNWSVENYPDHNKEKK